MRRIDRALKELNNFGRHNWVSLPNPILECIGSALEESVRTYVWERHPDLQGETLPDEVVKAFASLYNPSGNPNRFGCGYIAGDGLRAVNGELVYTLTE